MKKEAAREGERKSDFYECWWHSSFLFIFSIYFILFISGGACPQFLTPDDVGAKSHSAAELYCGALEGTLARFETQAVADAYLGLRNGDLRWFALKKKQKFSFKKDCSPNYNDFASILPSIEWSNGSTKVTNFFNVLGIKPDNFKAEICSRTCFLIKTTTENNAPVALIEEKECDQEEKFLCYIPCRKLGASLLTGRKKFLSDELISLYMYSCVNWWAQIHVSLLLILFFILNVSWYFVFIAWT